MKNLRQKMILQLIAEFDIDTQEELISRLADAGYSVTQATISRDIKELRLTKISARDGSYKYAQTAVTEGRSNAKFINILRETTVSVALAGHLVVIKTYDGMASAAAAAIDTMKFDGLVGSLAGDDTIFLAASSVEAAESIVAKLNALLRK